MHKNILDKVTRCGLRRKLSQRTTTTYLVCIKRFLIYHKHKQVHKISKTDIAQYLEFLVEKRYTRKSLNVYYCAIKFLMEELLQKRRIWIALKFSKEQKKFPQALSKEQILELINTISNQQHKLMIQLMYGAGLRVSELINLRWDHHHDTYGWVRNGKGAKDRLFIIPRKIRDQIDKLPSHTHPYVFMSNRNKRYSPRTIYAIVKNAAIAANIPIHICYVTHLQPTF